MHISGWFGIYPYMINPCQMGRFGIYPYVYVSYKILLKNAHFGQVWNLPLRPQYNIRLMRNFQIHIGFGGFNKIYRISGKLFCNCEE